MSARPILIGCNCEHAHGREIPRSSSMQRGSLCLISRAVLGERKPAVQRIRVLSKHLTYSNTMSYSTVERGQPNTLDYRVFFRKYDFIFELSPLDLGCQSKSTRVHMLSFMCCMFVCIFDVHRVIYFPPVTNAGAHAC